MNHGTYLNLPGLRLWCVDTGGEGIPLVLLHANTGTCEAWRSQIDFFSLAGFHVQMLIIYF
jgi:hypothetical protein